VDAEVISEFSELLSLFRSHKVRYLVVGAYAVIQYTEPRYTKDLDLWVETSLENARRVHQALAEFGAPVANYTPADFVRPGMVHQIGLPPARVDILTSLPGVTFAKAWARRRRRRLGGEVLFIISLNDLIKNKKKAGRLQDTLDVTSLEKVRAKLRRSKAR
jgi:hypothetical protein